MTGNPLVTAILARIHLYKKLQQPKAAAGAKKNTIHFSILLQQVLYLLIALTMIEPAQHQ